jgi:hypothetical protein
MEISPYCKETPFLHRPGDRLSRPTTDEQKLYCWFYWIDKIMDTNQTRYVLDNLDLIPEFKVNWGRRLKRGKTKLF